MVVCVLATVAIAAWFASLPRGILMGDDLFTVYNAQHGGFLSNPLASLGQVAADRYRPILQFLLSIQIGLFGSNFAAYEFVNFLVELASAALVFGIARRLSLNWIVGVCAALTFAISRFSYYAVQQMFGLMEGLALAFFLLAVYDGIASSETGNRFRFLRTLLWFGLAIYTDERFVVLLPFVLLSGWLFFDKFESTRKDRWAFALIACAILLSNVALKTFAFHTRFLQGSGAQPITFDPGSIAGFLWSGFLNTIGFNAGPSYLSSLDLSEAAPWGFILGLLLATLVAVAVVSYFMLNRAKLSWREPVLALSAYVPLLLSASITFRQEFRWMYAAFATLVIILAAIAGRLRIRVGVINAFAVAFAVISLFSTSYYRNFISNVYFERSLAVADAVRSIELAHPAADTLIVTHGDATLEDWVFSNPMFFEEYGLHTTAHFANELSAAALPTESGPAPLILDVRGASVTRISAPFRSEAVRPVAYDFVARFPTGKINSTKKIGTPTGRGALILPWPDGDVSVASLTVLGGFRYTYPPITVRRRAVLTFFAAKPLAVGASARAFVDVTTNGKTTRIFQRDFPPSVGTDPAWAKFDVPLARFEKHSITVTFGADVIGANAVGAWIAFLAPEIVRSPY